MVKCDAAKGQSLSNVLLQHGRAADLLRRLAPARRKGSECPCHWRLTQPGGRPAGTRGAWEIQTGWLSTRASRHPEGDRRATKR